MKRVLMSAALMCVLSVTVGGQAYADGHKKEGDFKTKMMEMAGPLGPFAASERFPKSYFLMADNLPFMVGLALMHPMKDTLNLTDEQEAKIQAIKEATVPKVLEAARQIKDKEIVLANKIIDGEKATDQEALVDEIGQLRIALTKKHLACIDKVRAILTDDQFKIMQSYAGPRKGE